jgi:uncharacterized protein
MYPMVTAALMDRRLELGTVFARYPEVAAAYVFGSVARGEARPDSDLDIGVVYRRRDRGDHERIASSLALDLGKALEIDHIELVDLEAQGPIFRHGVLLEGRLLYEADRDRRVDFESNTLVRAFDFRPTYELATRGKVTALRRWLRSHHDFRTGPVKTRHSQDESRKTR